MRLLDIFTWNDRVYHVQAVVERMVGIKHLESPTEARRRL